MVIFIHHSVNPYRVAFFNALHKAGVNFKVYFLSKPAKNRKWTTADFKLDFPHLFLSGFKIYVPGNDHSYFQFNNDVYAQLRTDQPKLIITIGWNYSAAFIASWFCKRYKTPFVVWSESTMYEKSVQRTLTTPFVRWLLSQTTACIASGTRAKEYLMSLGVAEQQILVAYYTVDTEKLMSQREIAKSNTIDKKIRDELGIQAHQTMVLYVGQLIPRKGIESLIQIAKRLQQDDLIVFVCVGYGQMQRDLENANLANLKVVSFVKNAEIMQYFKASDICILLSYEETWGLVVNEAMCAGKPVIVSKYAGSSEDLVTDGQNGFVVDPKDIDQVVTKINIIADDQKIQLQFGQASKKRISEITLQQNISIIKDLIERN